MLRPLRTLVLAGVAMLSTSVLTLSLLAAPAEAGRRGTRVSGTLTASVSHPGGSVAMTGRVKAKGKHRRTVVLEQKVTSGWRKVDRTRSSRSGDYTVMVPTTWFYSSKLRARVVKTRKFRGDVSRAHRMKVVPAYTPLGSKSAWARLSRYGERFNPCRTITYGINTSRATPDADTVSAGIHNTVALVSQATGVRFRFAGETGAMPFDKRFRRKDPMLAFGFTTDAETKLDLGPSVAARGGADRTRWARDGRGRRILQTVNGGVLYDLDDTATMTATQFQQLTLHEVGHVMGLAHVSPPDQYMTPGSALYNLPLSYQAGDLNGLSKVGLQGGCIRPLRSSRKPVLQRIRVPVATTLD